MRESTQVQSPQSRSPGYRSRKTDLKSTSSLAHGSQILEQYFALMTSQIKRQFDQTIQQYSQKQTDLTNRLLGLGPKIPAQLEGQIFSNLKENVRMFTKYQYLKVDREMERIKGLAQGPEECDYIHIWELVSKLNNQIVDNNKEVQQGIPGLLKQSQQRFKSGYLLKRVRSGQLLRYEPSTPKKSENPFFKSKQGPTTEVVRKSPYLYSRERKANGQFNQVSQAQKYPGSVNMQRESDSQPASEKDTVRDSQDIQHKFELNCEYIERLERFNQVLIDEKKQLTKK